MTLAVGYALGPLPGFSVGALGMLVSNFVLAETLKDAWPSGGFPDGTRREKGPGRNRSGGREDSHEPS